MLNRHVEDYLAELSRTLASLDRGLIWAVIEELMRAWRERRQVFLLGNGGSAALASHMANDLNKAVSVPGQARMRAISLVDSVPLMTAWANDSDYRNVFAEPLRNLCQPGDLVIAVSCSGNSANALEAVSTARLLGARTVALTGSSGGKLKQMVDVCLTVPTASIQQQEDVHLALNHLMTNVMQQWLETVAERQVVSPKALVLAAGEGRRLRPLTLRMPKPMVPLSGRPLLEHTLYWLRGHGIREIAINLHYMPEAIVRHFGDGSSMELLLTYSHEAEIMGTAGALRQLDGFLDGRPLVVVYGDVLTDLDLGALLAYHHQNVAREPRTLATMSLYRVDNPTEVGLVGIDESGRVTRFQEKPQPQQVFTDLASAGVMVVEPGIVEAIPPKTFYDFGTDLIPHLLAEGIPLYGWIVPPGTYLKDIGTPAKYGQAQREWSLRYKELVS